jgi:hypothetical protein
MVLPFLTGSGVASAVSWDRRLTGTLPRSLWVFVAPLAEMARPPAFQVVASAFARSLVGRM